MKRPTNLNQDLEKLYQKYYVKKKQTYHEFVRTVCIYLGWPTQRIYPLVKRFFPDPMYNGEQSIYANLHTPRFNPYPATRIVR